MLILSGDMGVNLNLPKKRAVQMPAGFIRRSLAFFIDLIIIQFIIISPFKWILLKIVPEYGISDALKAQSVSGPAYTISIFIILMILLYFTFTEFITGQSIGKKIMGLYIISDRGSLGLSQIILRNLALLPLFPFVLFWLIDPGFMIFTKSQKRLSDRFSRTRVIQVARA